MNPIEELLEEAIETNRFQAAIDPTSKKIVLHFKGGRSQTLHYEVKGDHLRLTSLVATATDVESMGRDAVIYWCWQRNRYTDVSGFSLDRHGRIIGQIEHPLSTLDAAELAFYLEALAIECDRFEYLFSGKDAQ